MMARLLGLRRDLGVLGVAALALFALVAAFHLLVLSPLQAKDQALREQLARYRPGAEAVQGGAGEKVGAVYAYLEKSEAATDWLAKLDGIGAATGVQLRSASYQTRRTAGRIVRYEMVLPVAGSYPQIREFLRRSLAEIPVMSVDQLTLKRAARDDAMVQTELHLTLHMVSS